MSASELGVVKAKRRRVIDILRKTLGGEWTYDRRYRLWSCSDGREVTCHAALAPRYDGDDDSYALVYYLRTSDGESKQLSMGLGWAL